METDKRRAPRVPGYAKALLADGQIPGYVRDLSPSGCQVAFLQPTRAAVGDVLTVEVIAEHDPTIPPFLLRLTVRRIIDDPPWYSIGAQIGPHVDAQDEKAFQKLVRYYSGG